MHYFIYAQDTIEFTDLYGDYLGQTQPTDTPLVFAYDIISTVDLEHSPAIFTPDGNEVYWITARPPGLNNSDWLNRALTMQRKNNRWSVPINSPYFFNSISADGQKGLFWSHDKKDIFIVERQGDNWGDSKCLNILTRYPELQIAVDPSITNNGTIYFMSINEELGIQYNYGIYRIKLINGEYADPELLPHSINLPPFQNWTPFIAPDENYLIFSSNRDGQYGEGDLYISFHDNNTDMWSEPINMGETINTESQERLPGISPDGKYLFFTRYIPKRSDDVFWVSSKIIDILREKNIKK